MRTSTYIIFCILVLFLYAYYVYTKMQSDKKKSDSYCQFYDDLRLGKIKIYANTENCKCEEVKEKTKRKPKPKSKKS